MKEYYECLITVPASDVNYKEALKNVTDEELEAAIKALYEDMERGGMVKSRITACERELRRRKKVNK